MAPANPCGLALATRARPPSSATKLVVVGGPATGKTTLIGAVSDLGQITVETPAPRARATTAAMDFGRVGFEREDLYLFGTPGQDRFRFMWDRLAHGARGALLLADPRRVADSGPARVFLGTRRLPFVVLVNRFDDAPLPTPRQVRAELRLPVTVRVLTCDARVRSAARRVLATTLAHLRSRTRAATASVPPRPRTHRCGHPLTPPHQREHQ
ncbi:ATP-binding protein [Actinorhabdospora filicis]|uniref:ATP-binding protein n=1 Tax=Actinorhabdospora filicis TaxID=1785913 RepID=A0A9W6SIU4_9ACTN|nr:ATP/GTP-binding protein [Actinorhabdospora filicis]GLZ76755.1 ATP-binding protein [Actinorhabdospora filicis]